MSLQVWLPLNGTLNNQGLSDVTAINNGATVNTSGKIGSCYSFDTSKYITLQTPVSNTKEISYSCWVNISSWNSTTYDCLISISTGSGWQQSIATLCRNSGGTNLTWNIADGSTRGYVNSNTSLSLGTWYHVACTYDGSKLKIYINGAEDNSALSSLTLNFNSTKLYIGSWSGNNYNLKGLLNDVRIYNHCLSAKEVKELSKGLVCHYKLNNNSFGNHNLLVNTHFDSRYTVTAWDTSKNGTLCANGWGGYNGGVGNPSTVYHAHLQEHEGYYVYNYHKTSNEEWLGIAQGIADRVEVSKTYTFSCELKRVSGTNYANGGIYTKANSSASSNTFVNWFDFGAFSSVTDNAWHKYSQTFTISSSVDMTNGAYWYIYGHDGGSGEFLMRRPKLEEGLGSTEWIPHISDTLYSTLGLNSTTEYDCSGFGNNGTVKNQSSLYMERNSPRYTLSTVFNGTPYIIGQNLYGAKSTDALSLCAWINPSQVSGEYYIISSYEGGGAGLHISSGIIYFQIYSSGYVNVSGGNVSANTWYHVVGTYDNSSLKIYVNGELKGQISKTGAITYNSATPWAVAVNPSATSGITDGGYYYGKLSDVRIYATALSSDDVKELYDTPASIDKLGNIYAYEFKEE